MTEESVLEMLHFNGVLCLCKTPIEHYINLVTHNAHTYTLQDMHMDSKD
jgi:hypothetical protein